MFTTRATLPAKVDSGRAMPSMSFAVYFHNESCTSSEAAWDDAAVAVLRPEVATWGEVPEPEALNPPFTV